MLLIWNILEPKLVPDILGQAPDMNSKAPGPPAVGPVGNGEWLYMVTVSPNSKVNSMIGLATSLTGLVIAIPGAEWKNASKHL